MAEEGSISERGAKPPSHILSPSPNIIIQGFLQSLGLERGIKGVRLRLGEVQIIKR